MHRRISIHLSFSLPLISLLTEEKMFLKTLLVPCLFVLFGMASSLPELEVFFMFFFKVYKDGTIEKLDTADPRVPASLDPETGVQSKDIVISPQTNVSARLYIPKSSNVSEPGIPLLVYFHGGGFSTGSAASLGVHRYLNSLVAKANIVVVSVNYRLAPENPLPIGYDDSWAVLQWVASHGNGDGGQEEWLKKYVDFNRVHFAGDSAGANIAHNMAMRVGSEKLGCVNLKGIVLIHPYFLLRQPTASLLAVNEQMRNNVTKLWSYVCPSSSGSDDSRVNPVMDPQLSSLACRRVLVFLAEKDPLIDAGKNYGEALRRGGQKEVQFFMTKGKGHVFHLRQPNSREAGEMLDRVASFVNAF